MQSTRHDFLMVHAAVMPTNVFPAPQGKTIIPERARLYGVSHREHGKSDFSRTRSQTFYSDLSPDMVE